MEEKHMNCFVIMPFSKDFDDVYAMIKNVVESIVSTQGGRCFRLDEARPAGRITDRLISEIRAATICIADVTGNSPNVMWELGYAMALEKPTLLLTQKIQELPFDVKDLQNLEYNRNYLNNTLGTHLRIMILDTIDAITSSSGNSMNGQLKERDELVGILLKEVGNLKEIISSAVSNWGPSPYSDVKEPTSHLTSLEGAWVNRQSGTHYYSRIVNGELIVPYCYMDNNEITGVYYGWRRLGEYWFGRFVWLEGNISGFTFLKQETLNSLSGAWWYDDEVDLIPNAPPAQEGVPVRWDRESLAEFPEWALQLFQKFSIHGFAGIILNK
jgi:hypothetical protein